MTGQTMTADAKKEGRILRRGPSLGRKRPGNDEPPFPVQHPKMPQRTKYMLRRKKQGRPATIPRFFSQLRRSEAA
jgi:hypothetical protein